MEICELQREDERAWDEYILKSEHSTFYHQIGWRSVVEKTYKPVYLIGDKLRELYEEFLYGVCSMEFLAEQLGLNICEASNILERGD